MEASFHPLLAWLARPIKSAKACIDGALVGFWTELVGRPWGKAFGLGVDDSSILTVSES